MKYLLSFVFTCTLFIGVNAQTSLLSTISGNSGIVLEADIASTDLPDCLINTIIKQLEDESVTVEYVVTNTIGLRIYRYELSSGVIGYLSVSDSNCDAIIKYAARIEDL